jgi:hypothetical protein
MGAVLISAHLRKKGMAMPSFVSPNGIILVLVELLIIEEPLPVGRGSR